MALSIWTTRNYRRSQALHPRSAESPFEETEEADKEVTFDLLTDEEIAADHKQFMEAARYPIGYPPGTMSILPGSVSVLGLPTQSRKYRVAKRALDLVLSILFMPVIAVLLALIGGIIALTSGLPVFYRQERIGQHGRTFRIWKFRTMKTDADRVLAHWLKENPDARLEWQQTHKLKDDPRITALGRFLRRTSLDELPQIFNVLTGDMSLVGPRPIVHAERAKYADRFAFYTAVVPGVTGLWQVSGRCDVSYTVRVKLDEHYVRTWNIAEDIRILIRTPRSVFCRHGAY